MNASTFDRLKRLKVETAHELTPHELTSLQSCLLGIYDDIAAVCRDEAIPFQLGGGSALGAVRHGGPIPWDDDLDLNVCRADWLRLRAALTQRYGWKYAIYEPGAPRGYSLAFPRVRLRGTRVVMREDAVTRDIEPGAFIDVFLLESTFDNGLARMFHGLGSLALGFAYSCRKQFHERRILRAWGVCGGVFAFKRLTGALLAWGSMGFWTRLWDSWNGLCRKADSTYVTFPVGRRHFFGELAQRKDMLSSHEVVFAGRRAFVAADVKGYLTRLYGPGYMTPPPEAARERHVLLEPPDLGDGLVRRLAAGGLKILVAAHKPYPMPADPSLVPIHVGAAGKPAIPGFARDDTGDNISERNANYCELTGLYWAWRNLSCEYLGLAHYRRHFAADGETMRRMLTTADLILPKRRNYYIETNYSQYAHAHHAEDLDLTRTIVSELCPEYLPAFDAVMNRRTGHRFNMFVMRKELADAYCTWLFAILFELEKRLDISGYTAYDARVFGFVSERLLDVWVETRGITFRELPVLSLESQHWPRKIVAFLRRKFCHKDWKRTGTSHGE